jgi:hypothetical protein
MSKYLNNSNINLSIAVWLASDEYDHNDDQNVISTTTLLKPLRPTILAARVQDSEDAKVDLVSRLKSRMGTAIHDAIERSWVNKDNVTKVMLDLGYPKRVVESVVVNPDPTTVTDDVFPVYLEQRVHKDIAGMTVSGKYDGIYNGTVEDIKTTGTYSYVKGNKVDDYILQGSIYRWLNPTIITNDVVRINYIFTDWSPAQSYQKGYPESPVLTEEYELMTLAQTEQWIRNRINQLRNLWDAPESELPFCTDADLWREPPVYKYYAKSKSEQTKSTKNFDNSLEAYNYYSSKGRVGELVEVAGKVKACKWCKAFTECSQKNQYILDGSLDI